MPLGMHRRPRSVPRILAIVLASALAGLLVGAFAGWSIAVQTAAQNWIGLALDGLTLCVYLAVIYGCLLGLAGAALGGLAALFALVPARKSALVPARGPSFARRITPGTVFAASFALLAAAWLFLSGMRYFNESLYFDEYPFIDSYGEMRLFFLARTLLIALIAAGAGFAVYRLVRRAPRATLVTLVAILAGTTLISGFRSREPVRLLAADPPALVPRGDAPAILLIGWDGATWHVMDRLLAAGKMPNTERLIARGTRADLKTPAHTVSPAVWTTIYTGKESRRHGIYGFDYYVIPGIGHPLAPPWRGLGITRLIGLALRRHWIDVVIVNRTLRRATPIWSMMNRAGRSAGVVGPLVSWPAEAVEPFLISNLAGDVARKVRKGKLSAEAFDAEDLYYPPRLDRSVRDEILATERWGSAIGPGLFAKYRPDLFVIYSGEPDGTQHKFWKWMEPRYYSGVADEDVARYGGAIEREYVHADSVLGRFLESAGDSTTILILSDHGFAPAYRGGLHQAGHDHGPDGILIAAGPPIRRGAHLESARVVDVAPTVLALAGLPVAGDMDGRALTGMIRPEFLARHPLDTIPTYEMDAARAGLRHSRAEDEVYEKLRSLGYIGD